LTSVKKLIPLAKKRLKGDKDNLLKLENYKKYIHIIETQESFRQDEILSFTENLTSIEAALKDIVNG
jgi:hypothetical protein